ncbi:sensor histidine kinase [Planomonospora corallina]|uniref:histidine kinase n=1 Tax=Planomonospora corallina TaxID=1806052 RepID=A0ABV8I2M1_9ACTN
MGDTHRVVYWIRRLSEIAMFCWLGLLLLLDVAVTVSLSEPAQFLVPLAGAYGVYAVWRRRRNRVRPLAVLMGLSFAVTFVAGAVPGCDLTPGFAETGALLILTIGALRWIEPVRNAALFAVTSMLVLEASAGRVGETEGSLVVGFMLFVAWSTAAGVGAYLRFQMERRREAVHAVRRAERLELARELHDLVAHHITGIVVQAQAAKVVAEAKPEAVAPALDAIAGAGADALTSMRRLVGVLRADEAARSPGTRLADMRLLVERFSAHGPQVAFEIGEGVTDETLPPEVMTTLHRVLQESLTNVRRHAPGTGWVEADLRLVDGAVRLRVRNYGSASDSKLSRLGGGFGLVGMAERVEALGGRLYAGPTPEGAWEVFVEFAVS